jgi:uncharacterized protein
MAVLAVLGVLAGITTTVAGLGGGVLLLLCLGAWWDDPVRALAVSTPALMVGNLHRAVLYRRDLPWAVALPYAGWAWVGAAVGGALALQVSPVALQAALVASTAAAVVQHLGGFELRVPPRGLNAAGGVVGLLSTAGGAGILSGPVLLSAGLTGGAYLGALSLAGVAMHVGRLGALAVGGALDAGVLADAAVLGLLIPVGNWLGSRLRVQVDDLGLRRVEVGTCALLAALSVAGVLR